MKTPKRKSSELDLPEEIRLSISGEVESGLRHLERGNFEARLRSHVRSVSMPPTCILYPRWRPLGRAVVVLLGATGVAALILWLSRGPAPAIPALASALAELPGFQTLSRAGEFGPSPSLGDLPAALSRSLTIAAAAAAVAGPPITEPREIAPRYSLEKKLEILTREKPIERALELIKPFFREV